MAKKQIKDIFEQYEPFKALKFTEEEKAKWEPLAQKIFMDDMACAALPYDKCISPSFLHTCLVRDEYTNEIVIKTRICNKAKLRSNYLIRQFSSNKLNLSLLNNKQSVPITDPREEKINQLLLDSIKNNKLIGFCLSGAVGIGKSYKVISYCNDMIMQNNRTVSYVFLPELVRKMKENFDQDSYYNKKIIDDCCQADILVLDDFGAEYTSSWFYLNVLLVILNYRSEEEKPIIVISNFTMPKLLALLKKSMSLKDTRIDAETQEIMISRLWDRLAQLVNGTKCTYTGESRRKK